MDSFLVIAHVAWLEKRLPSTALDATVLESYCDDMDTGFLSATLETEMNESTNHVKN